MRRASIGVILLAGWLLLAASAAPILGMGLTLLEPGRIGTELVKIPAPGRLLLYSGTVSFIATVLALAAALGPAVLLGEARSHRRNRLLLSVCIMPLLVPPQVYAYAWNLTTAPASLWTSGLAAALPPVSGSSAWGSAIRAGLISAGWLWPLAALIVAAGWRTTGRGVYTLALIDTTPMRAFFGAVLPSLRGHLLAAACVVFIVTLVEYPIPHLCLARTYATELLLLVDVGAPAGQVIQTALPAVGIVLAVLLLARLAMSSVHRWGAGDEETGGVHVGRSFWALVWLSLLWLVTFGVPLISMIGSLRIAARWREAVTLLAEEWWVSSAVSLAAAGVAVLITVATVVRGSASAKHRATSSVSLMGAGGALLAGFGAMLPAAALGIGFVRIYNVALPALESRLATTVLRMKPATILEHGGYVGDLYTHTPVVWILSLAARYAVIPIVIVALALRGRWIVAVEQAQVDGARPADVLWHIMLPVLWPSLLAGGAIAALLSLSEVVISQLVHPVGYPSIALTILGLMHYGRDDTVIIASLLIVTAGVILAQLTSWLLLRRT